MDKRSGMVVWRLVAIALLMWVPLVGPADAQVKTSFAPTTLQISIGHAAVSSIPLGMGYWKEEGLDVDVFGVNGSTAGIQQLAAGNLDFCSVGGEALLAARAKGAKVRAVYMYARRPIYHTVVLASSKIQTLKDLRGQTIGRSSTTEANVLFTNAALRSEGLDPDKDVTWLTVPVGAFAMALQKGDIGALSSWDTMIASLQARGLTFRDLEPAYNDELFGNVIIAREDTIEKQPDLVVKVLRGIAKATQFGLANPEAAVRLHWKLYPQTKPQNADETAAMRESLGIFESRFKELELSDTTKYGENLPAQWTRVTKIAEEEKIVPPDFDPSGLWTNQFVDAVNAFDRAAVIAQAKAWKE